MWIKKPNGTLLDLSSGTAIDVSASSLRRNGTPVATLPDRATAVQAFQNVVDGLEALGTLVDLTPEGMGS